MKIRELGKESISHNDDAARHMLILNGAVLQGYCTSTSLPRSLVYGKYQSRA